MTRNGWIATMIGCVLLVPGVATALEDTPENRAREADRYLAATPPRGLIRDISEQMARNLPPENREPFVLLMTKHLDLTELARAMKESMVRHFTANELEALASFYGSEVGQSAMKKYGAYMAEVMPIIQGEIVKAQAKANREMSAETEAGKTSPSVEAEKR